MVVLVLRLVLGMLPLGVRPWVGSGLSVVLGRDVVSNSGGRRMEECHLEEQVSVNTLHVKSSQALTGQDDSHQQPQQQEQQATEQQDTEAGEVAVWL